MYLLVSAPVAHIKSLHTRFLCVTYRRHHSWPTCRRAIGGLVELYLFLGPTPEEVIRQYHQVVGKPMMPPYWALGAQQGK